MTEIKISKFEIRKSHGRYPYLIIIWMEKSFIRKILGMKMKRISFTGYHGMWFNADTMAMAEPNLEIMLNDISGKHISV